MNRNHKSNPAARARSSESDQESAGQDDDGNTSAGTSDSCEPCEPQPPIPVEPPVITPEWQYWTPGPDSSVDIAWALVAWRQFEVRLYYGPAGDSLPDDSDDNGNSLIVDTTLGPQRSEVPFSLASENDPRPFLSGSFDYDLPASEKGHGTLTLYRLRYPGGYVEAHTLYTDPVP